MRANVRFGTVMAHFSWYHAFQNISQQDFVLRPGSSPQLDVLQYPEGALWDNEDVLSFEEKDVVCVHKGSYLDRGVNAATYSPGLCRHWIYDFRNSPGDGI